MRRFKILTVTLVVLVLLSGCCYTTKEHHVTATVTDKQYTESEFYMFYCHPVYMPMTTPEMFEVTISYEGISTTYDNQKLYNSVEVGMRIDMILVDYYDKDGRLIDSILRLP